MSKDTEEIEVLRAEFAELKRERESRRELLAACEGLVPQMARGLDTIERRFTANVEALRHMPEVQHMRENGLMEYYAKVATRVRALEEQMSELRKMMHELLTRLRRIAG